MDERTRAGAQAELLPLVSSLLAEASVALARIQGSGRYAGDKVEQSASELDAQSGEVVALQVGESFADRLGSSQIGRVFERLAQVPLEFLLS